MKQHRRRGFMLIQMLIVIGLIAAFIVVATRLFRLSLQTTTHAAAMQEDALRLEKITTQMRQDVWHATKIDRADKSQLHVTGPGLDTTWKSGPDGQLTRSDKEETQKWEHVGLEFDRRDSWVVVRRNGTDVALLRQLPSMGDVR